MSEKFNIRSSLSVEREMDHGIPQNRKISNHIHTRIHNRTKKDVLIQSTARSSGGAFAGLLWRSGGGCRKNVGLWSGRSRRGSSRFWIHDGKKERRILLPVLLFGCDGLRGGFFFFVRDSALMLTDCAKNNKIFVERKKDPNLPKRLKRLDVMW